MKEQPLPHEEVRQLEQEQFEDWLDQEADKAAVWYATECHTEWDFEETVRKMKPVFRQKIESVIPAETKLRLAPTTEGVS